MPKVPTYDNFQVNAGDVPAQRFEPARARPVEGELAVTPKEAAIPGEQMTEFSKSVGNVFEAAGDVAIKAQQYANAVRHDDAVNQLKQLQMDLTFGQADANGKRSGGYTSEMGINAFQRQSGKTMSQDYGEILQKRADEIMSSLGNDAQKQAFRQSADKLALQLRSDVEQHEAQQFRTYTESVRDATVRTSQDEMVLHYNKPDVIDTNIKSIQAATYDLAMMNGKSAAWAEQQAKIQSSNALVRVIGTALDKNDVTYAAGLVGKYSKQMTGDDLLRVSGAITKQQDNQVGLTAATGVIRNSLPLMVTSDLDRALNITLGAESNGRRYGANGLLLTSPKGAKGEMQVLDSTNTNPGFGVTPAKDDSPDERARVGRDYFSAMLKRYGSNLGMAWGAYNAGPGAMDKAIDEAKKAGTPDNWLAFMPKETQKYVANNLTAYNSGQGSFQRPTLLDVQNAIRNDPTLAGNPTRLKTALDEAERQYNDVTKSIKDRDDGIVANAYQALVANGGQYSALNPSLRAALPPEKVDTVMNFANRVAKGDDRTNEAVYQRLATDRAYLSSMSDNEFYALRSELSQSDFQHFANERGNLKKGGTGQAPGDLNTDAANRTLNDSLRLIGMDPTPKDGTDKAKQVGGIRRYVFNSLLSAQAQAGKKFTDKETADYINGMFAKDETFKGFFSNTRKPMLSMTASDLPRAVRKQIETDLKAQGISDATDQQIIEAYWNAKNVMPRGATGSY